MTNPNQEAFGVWAKDCYKLEINKLDKQYEHYDTHRAWLCWQESRKQTIDIISAYFAGLVGPEGAEEIRSLF